MQPFPDWRYLISITTPLGRLKMSNKLQKKLIALALLSLLAMAAAMPVRAGSVNKSVHIDAGATAGEATSVNGSVTVGENATVTGDVSTVNGTIRVHESARVEDVSTVNGALRISSGASVRDVETVNGSIRVDQNVTVEGRIEAVNGSIGVGKGSSVSHSVTNVNGEIEVVASEVGGDLATVNGDVYLADGATLHGDLIVEKPGGFNWGSKKRRVPEIVIGPGSRVLGTIALEREVKLYISESAEVGGVSGVMSMDDAIRFSGARP